MRRNHRRQLLAALMAGLSACSTVPLDQTMFDEAKFAQLKFLEGRYKGVGPDGKPFFEQYLLAGKRLLESSRYSDASFTVRTDGSSVALTDGSIISTWGQFTWKACSLSATKICFEPVNAPSSFCWEQVDNTTVSMTQRWADADGKAQSYSLLLKRLDE